MLHVDLEEAEEETYNIIPLHDILSDHAILRFPEIRAAHSALLAVEALAKPLGWNPNMETLDWLALLCGFQVGNVTNQREHIVMLLANIEMRQQPPPGLINRMDKIMVQKARKKVLNNYTDWCSSSAKTPNLWLKQGQPGARAEGASLQLSLASHLGRGC